MVAIAGPPNAGKSTLLNRVAQREAAIVSPYAGTTRDVIEVPLDLGGLPVTMLDTAGIRDTDDPVEREGVRRARERAATADLVLWVEDASDAPAGPMTDITFTTAPGRPLGAGERQETGGWAETATGIARFTVGKPGAEFPALEVGPSSEQVGLPPTRPAGPVVWRVRNKIDLGEPTDSIIDQEFTSTSSNESKIYNFISFRKLYRKNFIY
ncbi:MAG: GTPase [Polycyclovorans sp.]|nr:GTPase [Polycyclovorans sp.]